MRDALPAIETLKTELREWVEKQSRPGSRSARLRNACERELESSSRESILQGALDACAVAEFEAAAGADAVLDGDCGGWGRIANSVDYYYWFLRVDRADLAPIGRAYESFHNPFPWFMHTFCLAVALEKHSMARWFAEELQRFYKYGLAETESDDVPYREFIRLFTVSYLTNRWPSEDDLKNELGVYRELFLIGGVNELTAICNYHIEHALPGDMDDNAGSDRAFTWLPYTLLPAEVLAYLKHRENMGMPSLVSPHPLMNTLLAKPPEKLHFSKELLLQQLEDKSKKYFGIKDKESKLIGLFRNKLSSLRTLA